tara:strand:+ start:140 stop:349 length:210 start_codon:yes stop_codon:yes gene_type:complete
VSKNELSIYYYLKPNSVCSLVLENVLSVKELTIRLKIVSPKLREYPRIDLFEFERGKKKRAMPLYTKVV